MIINKRSGIQSLIFFSIVFSFLGLVSCSSSRRGADGAAGNNKHVQSVPYKLAKNYFVKNTASVKSTAIYKLESKAAFDDLFGAASVMGKNGTPTAINFTTQYVIALIAPQTNKTTELKVVSLKKQQNSILLSYQLREGATQSFSTQPNLVLIVDKKYDAPVQAESVSK